MQQPNLGHINFINCLPLSYGLTQGGFSENLTIHAHHPGQLNRMVQDGSLDVSPVSSIIYARHSEDLLVLPDVSISAPRGLQSILLVSKYPIEQLKTARIALTAKSATSHALLKIVLHHAYQVVPEYFISEATRAETALQTADAVLFIGDDALYGYHHRLPGYYYYDMGTEWEKLTGGMMVYALWVVNRSFAARSPEAVRLIYERVTGGFRYGVEHLSAAAASLAGQAPFDSQLIENYIRLLNYDFTPQHQAALKNYYQLAHGLQLIEAVPEIIFAKV